MHEDFLPRVDAEKRAQRCIRRDQLRGADARIRALIELVEARRLKLYENYRAGFGLDGNLREILKDFDDPSKRLPDIAIVKAFGAYSEIAVALLICAKFVCSSLTADSSIWEIVQIRKRAKIARVRQIKF